MWPLEHFSSNMTAYTLNKERTIFVYGEIGFELHSKNSEKYMQHKILYKNTATLRNYSSIQN